MTQASSCTEWTTDQPFTEDDVERTSGAAFLAQQGSSNHKHQRPWVKVIVVGICALTMLVALDVTAQRALATSTMTTQQKLPHYGRRQRQRRHLQIDDEIPIGEQVEQAIQDSMESGELGSDNPAVVNVSWVPLEDLEDDEPTDRGIVPTAEDNDDDDGLDRLWIIIMACAGAAVLCLIAVAYARLRKVEREMQQDEDQEENGDQEPAKPQDDVDQAGADTNDEDEEDEYEEEEIVEDPEGNVEDPSESSLGRFEVTRE